ncbi:MAG TPA: hypothetical protein VFN96_10290 [Gemmatimonadales bacterium]|nr:hypothetical protein [Gemmatimonadales bacterium]
MMAPDAKRRHWGASGVPGDSLVPLLPSGDGAPDPVAISTWHIALSESIAPEIPHELLALWLFPETGGVVLLGPDALAQDQVPMPEPAPRLLQDQLYALEEIFRRAQYQSALAIPVRNDRRDSGVMVLGGLDRGLYGPRQAQALQSFARRLAPVLDDLGRRMSAASPHVALEPSMTLEALPAHLGRASCEASDGPDLVRRASGILYGLLPHDRLEILVASGPEGTWSPLSGQLPRRRWAKADAALDPMAAIVARFDTAATLLIDDLTESVPEVEWTADPAGGSAVPIRGVVGSRLQVAGETVGFLILGSVARQAYRPDDEELVTAAAGFLAPRVGGLVGESRRDAVRAEAAVGTVSVPPVIRSVTLLAGTAHLGEALSRFGDELRKVVEHDALAIHLRWGEDEVVPIDAAALRPLADLTASPLAGFEGAPLLRGDREWLVRSVPEGEVVMVPLRVAGRPAGTLSLRSRGFASPRETAARAQPFADLLAPHLELLRRSAAPAPGRPARPATA